MEVQLLTPRTSRRAVQTKNVFFFQAEDGIRDTSVTGVQTCALPISRRIKMETVSVLIGPGARGDGSSPCSDANMSYISARSEERRVGKECRSRWARSQ